MICAMLRIRLTREQDNAIASPRRSSTLTLIWTEAIALALFCLGQGLMFFSFCMSRSSPVRTTRKTGVFSKDAFLVEYPLLLGVDVCCMVASVLNIVALSKLYFNQLMDAWEAMGRLGPPPTLQIFSWRMLISWAVWIDLAGRVCHALAFTSSALDSLAPFSIQKNKLGNWLVWFLAALGSVMLLMESLLLILNTQDPWYAICVPPLVFKARSKLSGLSIGFAFWGGLSLALGCLGLFEWGFGIATMDKEYMVPFTASLGLSNVLYVFSNICAVLGFLYKSKHEARHDDIEIGMPLALNNSIRRSIDLG